MYLIILLVGLIFFSLHTKKVETFGRKTDNFKFLQIKRNIGHDSLPDSFNARQPKKKRIHGFMRTYLYLKYAYFRADPALWYFTIVGMLKIYHHCSAMAEVVVKMKMNVSPQVFVVKWEFLLVLQPLHGWIW